MVKVLKHLEVGECIKMSPEESTFIRVTNKDIYQKILEMQETNHKQHQEILLHQQYTNGKVRLNRWISTTALSIVLTISLYLISGGI